MTADQGTAPPPWPVVGECHWPAESLVKAGHTCPQCDGSHVHEWVTWFDPPRNSDASAVIVGKSSGPGLPVRCRHCGGRKCDVAACRLRRHHRGEHELY